jgi:hypothetical protein
VGRRRALRQGLRTRRDAVHQPHAVDWQHGRERRDLGFTLDTAADERHGVRILSGEELGGDCRRGARPQRREAAGLDEGQRHVLHPVGEHDHALDRRQFEAPRVVGIVRVDLRGEDAAITDELGHFDVKSSARCGHTEHARAERAPCGMRPEGGLDGLDVVGQAQQTENVTTRQNEHSVYSWRYGRTCGRWRVRHFTDRHRLTGVMRNLLLRRPHVKVAEGMRCRPCISNQPLTAFTIVRITLVSHTKEVQRGESARGADGLQTLDAQRPF